MPYIVRFVLHVDDFYELGDYIEQSNVGNVSCAVYECTHIETGNEMAVKWVRKSQLLDEDSDIVEREFGIVQQLDCPNILNYYELFEDDKVRRYCCCV